MADMRLTLRQAAAALGVSESAIRKRVERGTLRSDKGPDGRRYVYLDTMADSVTDEGADASTTPEPGALISELRAHNDTLRDQLEAERHAHAEARRIIAGLVERIPAIEAPQEARESPQTVEEEQERVEANNTSEIAAPHSRPSGFLPPLQDKLALRDYVLAVAVPLAWFAFVTMINRLLNEILWNVPEIVDQSIMFAVNLVPLSVLLLLSGFWLGVRRRGGLSRTTLSVIGLPVAAFDVAVGTLVYFQDIGSSILSGVSIYLLVVAGALLGKAVQRRGLKSGIYGDDPAASTPRVQSKRAVSNLVIGGGAATIIAALIQAIAALVDR